MKNKKILGTIIGVSILSMPTTLKLSAMENKTTVETTQKNYNFCDDENFNYLLEDHLKYTLEEILVDDMIKYLYNCVDYIKTMPINNTYSFISTYPKHEELERELFENFKKYNENFIENNIKSNKNLKINFYYYKYLIYKVYDCAFYTLKNEFNRTLYDYIKNKKEAPVKVIEVLQRNRKQIFNGVLEAVKEIINTAKFYDKKKYSNIPKEYKTFGEYKEKNPKISIEDINDDIHEAIDNIGIYHSMDSVICQNLREIFENEGI